MFVNLFFNEHLNYFLDDADAEAEEVLNDLNRLAEGEDANMNLVGVNQRINEGSMKRRGLTGLVPVGDEEIDSSLGLGELAGLYLN